MADLSSFINIGANIANFVGDVTATNLGNASAIDLNGNAGTVLTGDGLWANAINVAGNITTSTNITGGQLYSTNSIADEGGQINLAIAAANTTLQNTVTVDVWQNRFRIFEGSANAKGAYIDLSTCGNSVTTPIVNRTSAIAAANTKVTFNNLTAQVGGSPTRLFIGAATANFQGAGQSQTMTSGSMAVGSWINVPISTGAGNEFAMSGALSSNGDTAVLNITDQSGGSGTWRVTGVIANTSSNLYSITIEQIA